MYFLQYISYITPQHIRVHGLVWMPETFGASNCYCVHPPFLSSSATDITNHSPLRVGRDTSAQAQPVSGVRVGVVLHEEVVSLLSPREQYPSLQMQSATYD